ncbi:hypothetical protein Y1Q_0011078 [Alligator mississippiensis]|uniref:Uncharacterized protein n=1 Tax=Alligator mississippiensis TaxID=8496 RepID=A0A151NWF7_ALLMI|nr:hypothetical protein Y1Q_0011078 [Alligator mississippiensis]
MITEMDLLTELTTNILLRNNQESELLMTALSFSLITTIKESLDNKRVGPGRNHCKPPRTLIMISGH